MEEENKLPIGWVIERLGSFVETEKGKKPRKLSKNKSDEYFLPYVDIKAFEKGVIEQYTDGYDCRLCQENDLLIVWDGSRSGLVGKAIKGALGSTLARLNFPSIYNNYAFYFLKSKYKQINAKAKGSGIPHVDPDLLWNYDFPIPPYNEQIRIVEKIEELFSELDNGIQNLKTAQEQLKVYRQSVLKWAFEGKLTESKRKKKNFPDTIRLLEYIKKKGKEYGIKLKYPEISLSDNLPKIPEEWLWIRNEELLKYVTSGSRDWKKYYSQSGSIFIRTQNIKTNNLELSDVAFVSLPAKAEGKRSLVEKGDLLMTITGANVGKVAFIEKKITEAYVSQSVALMKYLDTNLTKYMWYYFQSHHFGEGLINGLVYGVGRPVLSLENMKEVPVALCSIEEQNQIVQEIESRFSVVEKLEQTIEENLQKADTLRQSILKKAFEGKLVTQDPNDEPANILIDRIKQEKIQIVKTKPVRRKIMPEELKSIIEILKESEKPVSAKDAWLKSVHKDDIEEFYAELKKLQNEINVETHEKESLLSLKK